MHIWRSRYAGGKYLPPELVTIGNPAETLHDPAIAPDQSFIVFDSGRVKGGLGRLCIAFREGDHWSAPIDLGDAINKDLPWGAHLAPDGHTVYVTGQSGIWQISLDPWLKTRTPAKKTISGSTTRVAPSGITPMGGPFKP
jgi:hypothetical protein